MKESQLERKHIFIVTSGIHQGKSSYLQKLVDSFGEQLRICGFISRGTWNKGERSGFILEEAGGERSTPLATTKVMESAIRQGRFYFYPEAFQHGTGWVNEGLGKGCNLLVVDEVGPLELDHGGWYSLLEETCNEVRGACLWVVRESCLSEVTVKWKIPGENIFRAVPGGEAELKQSILTYVKKNESPPA